MFIAIRRKADTQCYPVKVQTGRAMSGTVHTEQQAPIVDDGTAPTIYCSKLVDVALIGDGNAQFTLVRSRRFPGSDGIDQHVEAVIIVPVAAILPAIKLMMIAVTEAGLQTVAQVLLQ